MQPLGRAGTLQRCLPAFLPEPPPAPTLATLLPRAADSVLREGASTIPKGLAASFWGVDVDSAATHKARLRGQAGPGCSCSLLLRARCRQARSVGCRG